MTQLVKYRTERGVVVAFIQTGRTQIAVVQMDSGGLKIRRVAMAERRYMTGLDYPIARARRAFLRAGKNFGITKSAKALIRSCA